MSLKFDVPNGVSIAWPRIDGYRITGVFRPGVGFGNNFYIYVVERQGPGDLLAPIDIGPGGKIQRGELQFAATDRKYVFRDINLLSVQTRASWKERVRLLEFAYESAISDPPGGAQGQGISYELHDNAKDQLAPGSLRDQYKYSLGGSYDNLFSFSQWQSRDQARDIDLIRFSSRPNEKNSWLNKIIELSKSLASGSARPTDYWDIKFTQAKNNSIVVQHSRLQAFYLDHSAGHLLDFPLRSLDSVSESALQNSVVDVRLHFSSNARPAEDPIRSLQFQPSSNEVVETATLAFKQNTNLDLPVK